MPDLIYNIKLNLDKGSLGKIVEPSAERDVQNLEQQVRELEEALERAGNESVTFNKQFKNTTKQAGASNKAFSSTNQVLFSFSDGVQDAAQFSQGLAQGMRAIGNNVGFTAELFANLTTRVRDYNDNLTDAEKAAGKTKTVTGELKGAFFSAGGALLILNAALTAGQFAFNNLTKQSKEAEEAVKGFIDEATSLVDIGGFDFLNIESTRRQIQIIEGLVESVKEARQPITQTANSTATAVSNAFTPIGAQFKQIDNQIKTVEESLTPLAGVSTDDLKDRLDELRKTLAINVALFENDPLAQFIDAQSRATQETLLLFDAGLKSNEFLEQRKNELEALIKTETDSGLATDESKARYIELNKQLDAVNGAIKTYNSDLKEQARKDKELAEQKIKLIKEIDKQNASIASLNASLMFGDATSQAIELSNNYQISIDELTRKMDEAEDSAKGYYKELINGEAQLRQLRGTQLLKDTLESFKPEGMINQFDSLIMRQGDAITSLATMLKAGIIDDETYRNAILRLQGFVNTQESILVSQTVGAVAKAAGAFGELFGASKEFRIAMAVADGAAAVVSTLASVPFPANLAAAASIAAQVAQQIKTIKNAKIGGSNTIEQPSSSVSGIISSSEVSQPTQSITFLPNAATSGQAPPTVDVKIDRAGLAVAVNKGNRELANKQVRV